MAKIFWIWSTDGISCNFPSKEFINGRVMRESDFGARIAIFTISRVKNLSTAGPRLNYLVF